MASLAEMIQFAEYQKQQSMASDPMQVMAAALSRGVETGYAKGSEQQGLKILETAAKIRKLRAEAEVAERIKKGWDEFGSGDEPKSENVRTNRGKTDKLIQKKAIAGGAEKLEIIGGEENLDAYPEAVKNPFDVPSEKVEYVKDPLSKHGIKRTTKNAKEQIYDNIKNIKDQGGEWNEKEKMFMNKYIGLDSPNKKLRDQKIDTLSARNQNVLSQIEEGMKVAVKARAKGEAAQEPDEIVKSYLGELLEREDEAKEKGIDIDAILELVGYTREELIGEKSKGLKAKAAKMLTNWANTLSKD